MWPFTFPPQQHHLSAGNSVYDPATGRWAGRIETLDEEAGTLRLRRGPNLEDVPLPTALIPGGPVPTLVQQQALRRLARSVLAGDDAQLAAKSILVREPFAVPLVQDDLAAAKELVARLDGRHLVIQGPPGSGKTYTAARLIAHLIDLGRRVGVTSTSHKAIHNLIAEVEKTGVTFRGLKKGDTYESLSWGRPQTRRSSPTRTTTWCCSRARRGCSRARTCKALSTRCSSTRQGRCRSPTRSRSVRARGTSCCSAIRSSSRQVSQGIHPEGAAVSVLEHLLGGEDTVPPERGLFLSRTWRMHPDVCRLHLGDVVRGTAPCGAGDASGSGSTRRGCRGRGCAGCRSSTRGIAVRRPRRPTGSPSELELLIGGTFVDRGGVEHRIGWNDVLVVTPYNAQVRACARGSARALAIGTVDKFQGQEAPVVFFSMATSSGDDLPRNLEFLFSRNRLNVAISRAQSLAVLVASPKLLEIRCRTIEQMRMVNALCRFVEEAN